MPESRVAVFLDRDGVINRSVIRGGKPRAPERLSDFDLLPDVPDAVHALRRAGFLIFVVTNQPEVAKGTLTRETVDAMHARLRQHVAVDDITACFHVDADRCECRKPKPGMLLELATQWTVDLTRSYMVGDRWRDVEAGRAAGCRTILIGGGYGEGTADPDAMVQSLPEAAELILAESASRRHR